MNNKELAKLINDLNLAGVTARHISPEDEILLEVEGLLYEACGSLWEISKVLNSRSFSGDGGRLDEIDKAICRAAARRGFPPEINWKMTESIGDQDTIGELKDGRVFWTWNTGAGMDAEELLEMGEGDGENGGKVFASREELLDYLEGTRDDLFAFVQEKF